MAKKIKSIPGASKTVKALRDIGYELNSAVADILDNSISRGKANNIYITFIKNQSEKHNIFIGDDGVGMDPSILEEAMRIGSSNEAYSEDDLSKYGMGMKTASMSQASLITVLSKKDGFPEAAFAWDMEHVNRTNEWEILQLDAKEIQNFKSKILFKNKENFNVLLNAKKWTVVAWENLTNFQEDYNKSRSAAISENYYNRIIDNLSYYLEIVFHRFLTGENSVKKVNIYLNGKKLQGLDPFCREEPHTKEMPLSGKNGNFVIRNDCSPIVIRRYILPTNPKKPGNFKFSSVEAWLRAAGTESWNLSQGYYVYRNNRLISWGGWYKTKTIDEHDKLARASIDLNTEHDKLFTIDVKKTKVQFPEELRNHLKDNVNSNFIAEAKKRYAVEKEKTPVHIIKHGKISHLSTELVQEDQIKVSRGKKINELVIVNKYGSKITDDMTYKMLESNSKIVSRSFGDPVLFWKMVPNPNNDFQVMVNTDHPFYDLVYGDAEKNKKTVAVVDAFLFTMSFIELKCITNNNEMLFTQIKEVASSVLTKFITKDMI